jgi:hypothetical protein
MKKLIILIFIFINFSFLPILNTLAKESSTGICPQERKTKNAPKEIYEARNPLSKINTHMKEGKLLFEKTARPLQCAICHGVTRNGIRDPGFETTPSARNFTCKKTMAKISDGQLFWIIKNGSAGTSMPGFKSLEIKVFGNWCFIFETSHPENGELKWDLGVHSV